jgi:hypothetical protein
VPTFTANDVVWVLVGDTYHRGRVRYARMAKVFNLLVQQELIGGMLANPMALPLAKLEDQERLGLLMYVFPSLKTWRSVCDMPGDDLEEKQRKFFNRIVGVEAFITEGGLGTADWRKLPME